MNINLHIDRLVLVLDGIDMPRQQRPLLQAAVEVELGRLLAAGGLPVQQGMQVRSVQAGDVQVAAGSVEPQALGAQIAGAVYGGLNR